MKNNSKHLLNAIGEIDDELIKNAAPVSRQKTSSRFIRIGGIAAALALIAGGGLWCYQSGIFSPQNTPDHSYLHTVDSSEMNSAAPDAEPDILASNNPDIYDERVSDSAAGNTKQDAADSRTENNSRVDIAALLIPPSSAGNNIVEQSLRFMRPVILDSPAEYYQVSIHEDCTALLPQSIGTPLPGAENVYQIAGHNEFQYLISVDSDQNYELWEFHAFCIDTDEDVSTTIDTILENEQENTAKNMTYPYKKVLTEIYDIHSAEDIVSITVDPATINNTDAGKALQEKIGTLTITDSSEIAVIYDALMSMTCYGDNHWDLIDLGDNDAPVDGLSPLTATQYARYLTLQTAGGNTISSLKYTSYSDCFYEYGGVAYSRLSKETAASIDRILGIQ